ncbi:putative sulfate exporter family transporter [Catenulispora sp. NF23]|uniref:YeiH family protein n=1 Tax=Catenulispora pinistramenti TaxID=2705254 RepID=UPI001BA463A1|nr:putative sulfate exporter family transporter [Catenulispora pinistramenti]MBS2535074.1 putative sulfate exporter family transporter [Catenulispora pinistramenti]
MGKSGLPGLALTAGTVAVSWFANRMWPTLSPLTAAVILGVLAANLLPAATMSAARPGAQIAAKRLMRLGIVLLGLQLALGDVLKLGWQSLVLVVAVVFATFFGTQWLGRRMGLPGRQPLLIATGFAICGASAVAAMEGVTRRPGDSEDDPDPVLAVALVTLCGSLAILVLPLLRGPLGLHDPAMFGHWVGASVHDVGQVVATSSSGGAVAVNGAVVVKLMRVAMLAPMVAGTAVAWRRRVAVPTAEVAAAEAKLPVSVGVPALVGVGGGSPNTATEVTQPSDVAADPAATEAPVDAPSPPVAKHPPIVPLFVAGFLAMIALRTTGILPTSALNAGKQLQDLLLAAGMFGLGTGVRLRELARTGAKPLALGLASWALIASAAYIGVRLTS